jgi:hypothetical protein
MTWGALAVLPLELPVVVLGLMAIGPGRLGMAVRAVLVAALTLIVVLKSADFVAFTALARGFNPVADLPLVVSLVQLMAGSFGIVTAAAAVLGAVLLAATIAALLWWASGVFTQIRLAPARRAVSAVAATAFAVVAVAEIGNALGRWDLPLHPPGAAFTARVGVERVEMARTTLNELAAFRAAAASDPFALQDGLLDRIDRDVIVIFVESYGRTSFDTPFFAGRHLATLAQAQADMDARDLAMASSFLTSPTRGGQSWLAHATFANGLWVDNQMSYGAVLASGRETLFHIAARSGFRTAAVMPQITLEWPEAQFMGFETILESADLGYRGQPLNWVTMPDQFTLAAMDSLVRNPRDGDVPQFIQVALGSSHAPWVPVPALLDWDELGDGTVFDALLDGSDPPNIVWRDHDRVRSQYRLAIDYALQSVFAYALRHAADPPLMIVLGDHQAAGFVALDERPDVPIHVIGPRHLVERFSDAGFAAGLVPPVDTSARPMDTMRDAILRAFSSAATADTAPAPLLVSAPAAEDRANTTQAATPFPTAAPVLIP